MTEWMCGFVAGAVMVLITTAVYVWFCSWLTHRVIYYRWLSTASPSQVYEYYRKRIKRHTLLLWILTFGSYRRRGY